jgi:ABC-type transporter MlaC component
MFNGLFGKASFGSRVRALIAACVIASTVNLNGAQAQVSSSGKATIDKVSNLFSVWTESSQQSVYREAAALIDYNEMAEKAMGVHWGHLSPAERRQFTATLKHIIEQRYYKRWHKVFAKGELAYKSEAPVEGDLFIRTALNVGRKNDVLIWRLSNRSGSYKVISIAVNNKDLLARLSTRLDARMKKKESFQQLLAWMRDESDVDEDEGVPKSHAISAISQKS